MAGDNAKESSFQQEYDALKKELTRVRAEIVQAQTVIVQSEEAVKLAETKAALQDTWKAHSVSEINKKNLFQNKGVIEEHKSVPKDTWIKDPATEKQDNEILARHLQASLQRERDQVQASKMKNPKPLKSEVAVGSAVNARQKEAMRERVQSGQSNNKYEPIPASITTKPNVNIDYTKQINAAFKAINDAQKVIKNNEEKEKALEKKLENLDKAVGNNVKKYVNQLFETEKTMDTKIKECLNVIDSKPLNLPAGLKARFDKMMEPLREIKKLSDQADENKSEFYNKKPVASDNVKQSLAKLSDAMSCNEMKDRQEQYKKAFFNGVSDAAFVRELKSAAKSNSHLSAVLKYLESGMENVSILLVQRMPRYELYMTDIQRQMEATNKATGLNKDSVPFQSADMGQIQSISENVKKETSKVNNEIKLSEIAPIIDALNAKKAELESESKGYRANISSTYKEKTENKVNQLKTLIDGIEAAGVDHVKIRQFLEIAKNDPALMSSRGVLGKTDTVKQIDNCIKIIDDIAPAAAAAMQKKLPTLAEYHREIMTSASAPSPAVSPRAESSSIKDKDEVKKIIIETQFASSSITDARSPSTPIKSENAEIKEGKSVTKEKSNLLKWNKIKASDHTQTIANVMPAQTQLNSNSNAARNKSERSSQPTGPIEEQANKTQLKIK